MLAAWITLAHFSVSSAISILKLSGEKIGQRGAAAAIGHMHHVYAGHRFKQRAEEVGRVPVPGDAMLTLPGLALA